MSEQPTPAAAGTPAKSGGAATPGSTPSPAARRRRRRAAGDEPAAEPGRARPRSDGDRGLNDLVGGGRSQLGVDGALRGRDVNRPSQDDLAWAEENVVLVRRHWTPPPNR